MANASTLLAYIPHGFCLSWQPHLLAMHILSDGIIMLSYASIPFMLWKFVRARKDLQFSWIFMLFGAFILACGTTHAMSLWTIWHPDYFAAGVIKVITAIVSVGTALALWPLVPKAIALPGPTQWEAINNTLRQQIAEREVAEQEVRRQAAALQEANSHLEDELKERKLREAELQLAANVFEHSINSIVVTDAYGRIISVNPAFTTLTGYKRYEVMGCHLAEFNADADPDPQQYLDWNEVLEKGNWSGERWQRRKDGSIFCELLNISRVTLTRNHPPRYVAIMVDITERKHRDEQLEHLASHDPLTGLANRAHLMANIDRTLARAQLNGTHVALLFIDLDNFKPVNDQLGHEAGDTLLCIQAERLNKFMRDGDLVARLGGDEFVIMLDNLANPTHAEHIAERALQSLSQAITLGGTDVQVGASIGIACSPESGSTAVTLLKHADEAMYVAKKEGRLRWHRHQPTLDS